MLNNGTTFITGLNGSGVSPPDAIPLSSFTPTPSPTVAAAAKQQPVRYASHAAWTTTSQMDIHQTNEREMVCTPAELKYRETSQIRERNSPHKPALVARMFSSTRRDTWAVVAAHEQN